MKVANIIPDISLFLFQKIFTWEGKERSSCSLGIQYMDTIYFCMLHILINTLEILHLNPTSITVKWTVTY